MLLLPEIYHASFDLAGSSVRHIPGDQIVRATYAMETVSRQDEAIIWSALGIMPKMIRAH